MRIELIKRPQQSALFSAVSPLLALGLTVIAGFIIFSLLGKPPLEALYIYFIEPLSETWQLHELAIKAAPLIMIAVGLSVCYASNNWNIGAEGQFIIGGIAGSLIPILMPGFQNFLTLPLMLLFGFIMERGLIKHFYNRAHADQILVTFGLAIVLQEIIKSIFGANPIPQTAPDAVRGAADIGAALGLDPGVIVYPYWRMVYLAFAGAIIAAVFAFLQFTTFGMVVRAGMADRHTVGLLGINIERRFTIVFAIAAVVAGLAGVMYTPILPPDYHMGMDFLVLSFVVVVVGGMGSLPGAVAAGFLLGILQSFASMNEIKAILPGIDQIIIYLVAVVILLVRPRGLMGRKGVMEN